MKTKEFSISVCNFACDFKELRGCKMCKQSCSIQFM